MSMLQYEYIRRRLPLPALGTSPLLPWIDACRPCRADVTGKYDRSGMHAISSEKIMSSQLGLHIERGCTSVTSVCWSGFTRRDKVSQSKQADAALKSNFPQPQHMNMQSSG